MFKYSLEQILSSSTVVNGRARTIYSGLCEWCGKVFWLMRPFRPNRVNRFCSGKCHALAEWKEKIESGYRGSLDRQGYVRWRVGQKQYRAHRFIMEQHLGRVLSSGEWVHHKNGDNADNRIENLVVVTHASPHHEVACPKCEYSFKVH